MIRRFLTTSHGEIAVRTIRICREVNIETVAVYPTVGKEALCVQPVDYAVCIGGPRANDNCLDMKNILSAACMTACDAIHPGFDFLSEDAKFVWLVLQCGLIFVGPDLDVIEQTGDKNNACRCMVEARVPVVPGSKDLLETVQDVTTMAEKIGYPVLIKVSSGGDGREVRRAGCAEELAGAFDAAKVEAHTNFGNGAAYVGKFIVEPRHVKV